MGFVCEDFVWSPSQVVQLPEQSTQNACASTERHSPGILEVHETRAGSGGVQENGNAGQGKGIGFLSSPES